jgi:hypothetical protein
MAVEAKLLAGAVRLGSGGVDVETANLSGELLLEPTHGGLHLGADRSAREIVVGHLERLRVAALDDTAEQGDAEQERQPAAHISISITIHQPLLNLRR